MIGAGAVVMIPALVIAGCSQSQRLSSKAGFRIPWHIFCRRRCGNHSRYPHRHWSQSPLGDALKPSITLQQVEQDKLAAKEMVR